MNEELNQALLQLESDLKAVQSANELINDITTSSKDFIEASKSTLKSFNVNAGNLDAAVCKLIDEYTSRSENNVEIINGLTAKLESDTSTSIERLAGLYQIEFEKSLTQAKNLLSDWTKELSEENKKMFSQYEGIWKAHNEEVDRLMAQHKELSEKVTELVSYLNSVNFPARLDKIDSSISANNTSIQNFYQQVDGIKSDLRNDLTRLENGHASKFTIGYVLIGIAIIIQVIHFFI